MENSIRRKTVLQQKLLNKGKTRIGYCPWCGIIMLHREKDNVDCISCSNPVTCDTENSND